MNHQVPYRLRVEVDAVSRIKRHLFGKGSFNVSKNQEVTPVDIIGSSYLPAGFRIINVSQELGIDPSEVSKYLKKKIGDRIYKGELLAQKDNGILGGKKNIISPTDGLLDFLNQKTGEVKINFLPKKVDLPAGVYGVVEDLDLAEGIITIKTQVTIIHGMFGSGHNRDGTLKIIGKNENLVDKSQITPDLNGQILVGGGMFFKEAISSAISSGVCGIITGGMSAADYKGMSGGRLVFPKKLDTDIGISIVVCEGFGSIPIGRDIYEVLKRFDGRFVTIDGNLGNIFLPSFDANSMVKIKSVTLPPLEQTNFYLYNKYQTQVQLKPGFKVRIVGNYNLGVEGKVLSIDQSETVLESKLRTTLATVETLDKKIKVPVANLESLDYSS